MKDTQTLKNVSDESFSVSSCLFDFNSIERVGIIQA